MKAFFVSGPNVGKVGPQGGRHFLPRLSAQVRSDKLGTGLADPVREWTRFVIWEQQGGFWKL